MQESVIDQLGKLGPALIALLVLMTTRAQNRWINTMALRAARVEDQKFRLALLDRRTVVLEKLLLAIETIWSDGTIGEASSAAANEALRVAELVFDDEERSEIAELLRKSRRWHMLDQRAQRYAASTRLDDKDKYERIVNEMAIIEAEMIAAFEPLMVRLKTASRVQSVPQLQPTRARLVSWFTQRS